MLKLSTILGRLMCRCGDPFCPASRFRFSTPSVNTNWETFLVRLESFAVKKGPRSGRVRAWIILRGFPTTSATRAPVCRRAREEPGRKGAPQISAATA